MTRIKEITLYQFDELNDPAKETARDWYRGCIESDEIANEDDWDDISRILGISFATHDIPLMNGSTRQAPKIWWSGFSSQGDGASWEGWYSYAKGAPAAIRAYAPIDNELHRIADTLQAVQRVNGYKLTASVTTSGYYSHSGTMSVDVEKDTLAPLSQDTHATIQTLMRDFADWIYRQLEAQWEYLNSAEAVDESIRCNEYSFLEDGSRHD